MMTEEVNVNNYCSLVFITILLRIIIIIIIIILYYIILYYIILYYIILYYIILYIMVSIPHKNIGHLKLINSPSKPGQSMQYFSNLTQGDICPIIYYFFYFSFSICNYNKTYHRIIFERWLWSIFVIFCVPSIIWNSIESVPSMGLVGSFGPFLKCYFWFMFPPLKPLCKIIFLK